MLFCALFVSSPAPLCIRGDVRTYDFRPFADLGKGDCSAYIGRRSAYNGNFVKEAACAGESWGC